MCCDTLALARNVLSLLDVESPNDFQVQVLYQQSTRRGVKKAREVAASLCVLLRSCLGNPSLKTAKVYHAILGVVALIKGPTQEATTVRDSPVIADHMHTHIVRPYAHLLCPIVGTPIRA